jgi:methyltransferase (TIGR00027 family)
MDRAVFFVFRDPSLTPTHHLAQDDGVVILVSGEENIGAMEHGQASRTAERVAERRAVHQLIDVPPVFVDPLALRILRPDVAARVTAHPRESNRSPYSKYLRAFLAVRSRVAEEEVASAVAAGVDQYVVLGAGFDTFAYRNPFPALRVFEVDHPATQAVKRERLRQAGIDVPSNAGLVAADLAVTGTRAALARGGFDAERPAVFAWLGVVLYLERAAIEATLADIGSLAAGTRLVFDYGLPPRTLSFAGRIAVNVMAARVAAAGEPWKTFFSPDEVRGVLDRAGFSAVEDLGAAELNARYFDGRRDRLRVGEAGRIARAVV